METHASTLPGLEFGTEQLATFAPLAPAIEAFALEYGLGLERTLDRDPVVAFAAYFLLWEPKGMRKGFIRIGALRPLEVGSEFEVAANVGWKRHRKWAYSTGEGNIRLREVLAEAAQFIERSLAGDSVGFGETETKSIDGPEQNP